MSGIGSVSSRTRRPWVVPSVSGSAFRACANTLRSRMAMGAMRQPRCEHLDCPSRCEQEIVDAGLQARPEVPVLTRVERGIEAADVLDYRPAHDAGMD